MSQVCLKLLKFESLDVHERQTEWSVKFTFTSNKIIISSDTIEM